ncbi:MAG: hypothetical protein LBV40_05225 [Methanomicrobiales archaeon]|jgi:hypothetical protein|nr:hypothetical protein [Methanomicrobiales archaeon]
MSVSAETPVLPCEFYGPLYIHGEPAPAATIIEAKIGGVVYGMIVTTDQGAYGGPGTFDQRLKVVVDSSILAQNNLIEFWIDGQKAEQSLSYGPGSSIQMVLSVGLPPAVLQAPTIKETSSQTPTIVQTKPPTSAPTSVPGPTYTVPPDVTPTAIPTAIPTLRPTDPYTSFPTSTPLPTANPVNQDQLPAFAQTFWGSVRMYDDPIQAGGYVEARVTGVDISGPNNPVTTGLGFFGRPQSLWPNLEVQGVEEGARIEFWVWDSIHRASRAYVRIVGEEWQNFLPFQPGESTEIELSIQNKIPTPVETIPPAAIPVSECDSGVPILPMQIWGSVYFNNINAAQIAEAKQLDLDLYTYLTPIQRGGKVEAVIDGYDVSGPTNPLTLRSAISFGSGTYDEKLAIQGSCVPDNTEIRFRVWDVYWQRPVSALIHLADEPQGVYHESIPYRAGEMVEVMLLVGSPPESLEVHPTPTPTPNTAPHKFYGKAEFNGYPLRSGDMILATTEGVDLRNPMNPYTVHEFGTFGNPAGSDMLIIEVPYWADRIEYSDSNIIITDNTGSTAAGVSQRVAVQRVPINFWIKPQNYEYWYKAQVRNPLAGDIWSNSYPFMPGSIANVELKTAVDSQFMSFQDIVSNLHAVYLPSDTSEW